MEFGSKEYNMILNEYRKGMDWLNDVSIDIEEGPNELPPLVLLRAYEAEPTVDTNIALATQFIMNKHVKFFRKGTCIHEFTYNGGDLGDKFANAPFLLDLLLKLCYGLMVKKLTPPSAGFDNEDKA